MNIIICIYFFMSIYQSEGHSNDHNCTVCGMAADPKDTLLTSDLFLNNISVPTEWKKAEPPHRYPWLVSLHIDSKIVCIGFLVSPTFVLTSASCFFSPNSKSSSDCHGSKVSLDCYANPGQAHIGVISDQGSWKSPQQFLNVRKFVPHPDFNPANSTCDIGLVELSQRVNCTPDLSQICLPTDDMEKKQLYIDGAAYGLGGGSDLKVAELKQVDEMKCQESNDLMQASLDSILCTTGKTELCRNDTMIALFGSVDSRFYALGLTSRDTSCSAFTAFNKIFYFKYWIKSYINNHTDEENRIGTSLTTDQYSGASTLHLSTYYGSTAEDYDYYSVGLFNKSTKKDEITSTSIVSHQFTEESTLNYISSINDNDGEGSSVMNDEFQEKTTEGNTITNTVNDADGYEEALTTQTTTIISEVIANNDNFSSESAMFLTSTRKDKVINNEEYDFSLITEVDNQFEEETTLKSTTVINNNDGEGSSVMNDELGTIEDKITNDITVITNDKFSSEPFHTSTRSSITNGEYEYSVRTKSEPTPTSDSSEKVSFKHDNIKSNKGGTNMDSVFVTSYEENIPDGTVSLNYESDRKNKFTTTLKQEISIGEGVEVDSFTIELTQSPYPITKKDEVHSETNYEESEVITEFKERKRKTIKRVLENIVEANQNVDIMRKKEELIINRKAQYLT